MVYGKRAASSLFALSETLKRRALHMGEKTEAEAMLDAERLDEADEEPGGPASLSRSPEVRGRRASVSPRAIPVAARTVPAEISRRHSEWFHAANEIERSEEHTSELQSRPHLVCRLLLEKKK